MSDIWSDASVGRCTAGEAEAFIRRMDVSTPKPPLIFCHQHQASTLAVLAADYYRTLFWALAEDYTVCIADLGYVAGQADLWGNSVNVTRVGAAYQGLLNLGCTGKATIVTCSHGNLAGMTWTKQNPTLVEAVAAITPALSLASLRTVNGGVYAAPIDSRYSGGYTDATYGSNYSPHIYRNAYPQSTVPTALWTAPNDTIVLNTYADDFVNNVFFDPGQTRPWTRRYMLSAGLDHGEAAIADAVPGVIDWLRGNRNKG